MTLKIEDRTVAGAMSTLQPLYPYQCNFFHFSKQTATLSRLPPQESNSLFLQANQTDAVSCPSNSVHAFFQAMPHPATSQTGLKRKGPFTQHLFFKGC